MLVVESRVVQLEHQRRFAEQLTSHQARVHHQRQVQVNVSAVQGVGIFVGTILYTFQERHSVLSVGRAVVQSTGYRVLHIQVNVETTSTQSR